MNRSHCLTREIITKPRLFHNFGPMEFKHNTFYSSSPSDTHLKSKKNQNDMDRCMYVVYVY